ncbi:MAG TPA: hypothetical protein VG755_44250, partial [Nannocystaceae bacterium]|nr:hypothetical protein [Nannocystaceae bacterium]
NGLDDDCDGNVDNGCGCPHDLCTTGAAMVSGCDPCVTSVCASDSFCCNNSWDSLCVNEVETICLSAICPYSCGHSLCSTGAAVTSGCDPSNCAGTICATDPFCCNNSFDGICVGETSSLCGLSC